MVELLIIADDFTGALDSGVQFAARGAATYVVTGPGCSFDSIPDDVRVLVLNAETRHLPAGKAYGIVSNAVKRALGAGVRCVYKKTDSALRGNIGSELAAVMDAAGIDRLPFIPAFPKMGRATREGIHYVKGVPVAESEFSSDPFNPVLFSSVADIIAQQSDRPVVTVGGRGGADGPKTAGVQVFDAETDGDLERIAARLGSEKLRFCAGCAGFAAALAGQLGINGEPPGLPELSPALLVICGSVNPVAVRQMERAEQSGVPQVYLSAGQKLGEGWLQSGECSAAADGWLGTLRREGALIINSNDAAQSGETKRYAAANGLSTEEVRVKISQTLGGIARRLLDGGLEATIMCTGGDTLLAMMGALEISELNPICELAPGVVLNRFCYGGRSFHAISKAGGFGGEDLIPSLLSTVRSGR